MSSPINPNFMTPAALGQAAATFQKTETNPNVQFVKENGLRAFAKHVQDQKLEELKRKAREEALKQLGLDEEQLAALEKKMPDAAFQTVLEDIERLTQDKLDKLIKNNFAQKSLEDTPEALSDEALPKPAKASEKSKALFVNFIT